MSETQHTESGEVESAKAQSTTVSDDGSMSAEILEIPYQTHPTIKPTLIWLWTTLLAGVTVIIYLDNNPQLLGYRETTNIAIQVIMVLTSIGILRLLLRIYVLKRTRYTIENTTIKREYELLLRSRERVVPFEKIRSHEMNQSRLQRLLGYGSVSLNQGLGVIELENIANPKKVHKTVGSLVQKTSKHEDDSPL